MSDGTHVHASGGFDAEKRYQHIHHFLDAVDTYGPDLLEEAIPDGIGSSQRSGV
jgi:hypothetical protein